MAVTVGEMQNEVAISKDDGDFAKDKNSILVKE